MERNILGGRRSRRTWQRTHKTQRAAERITLLFLRVRSSKREPNQQEQHKKLIHPKIDNSAAAGALPLFHYHAIAAVDGGGDCGDSRGGIV